MKNQSSEKPDSHDVERRDIVQKAGLLLGIGGALGVLAKPAAGQNNGSGGNGVSGATFLLTITDAVTGAFVLWPKWGISS